MSSWESGWENSWHELVPALPLPVLSVEGDCRNTLFILFLKTRKEGSRLSCTVAYKSFTSLLKIPAPPCARMGPGNRCRNCRPHPQEGASLCSWGIWRWSFPPRDLPFLVDIIKLLTGKGSRWQKQTNRRTHWVPSCVEGKCSYPLANF